MNVEEQLEPFFDAKSVAVVGASRSTGPGSFNVVENMIEFGYEGDIYPVNPKADKILDLKAYDDVREIEGPVEHAVMMVPRKIVPMILEGCVEKKIPAVTIASQGFAELGGEGKELQDKLLEIIDGTNTRIVGPNTLGTHNYVDKFTTSFIPFKERSYEPIGVVSQTGMWAASVPRLRYAKILDIGNASDVDHVDVLKYYKDDPDIKQVFLHIEGLHPSRGKELIATAREAIEEGMSIIAFKAGGSKTGAEYAKSHTGALAGEDRVFRGALKQAGIVSVNDYTQAEIASKALLKLPKMEGREIGMLTHHGATGTMAIDAFEQFGLEMAELSDETLKPIREMSPDWLEIGNPVDIWPALMGGPERAHKVALKALLEDENVKGILLSIHIADPTSWNLGVYGHIDACRELAPKYSKPVAVVPVGTDQGETRNELEKIENVAVFDNIRAAARALSILSKGG
ncbi:hypothetical protein AKJ44_01710 [candidate division MSBL1 archaeon SCGC-AAA261F17]|uniref:acetate--CoA ligase (ADP-forming) n=1 Tax=candidate division MSBL1 archaeon SCGC-AAA261F17 TaxID=1698274 RepID=A0A133V6A4_9EURY|nr:hypothetical protein AKJ44_01710 [candidate division MSBL1 archaeon SCGC-AAA261F17]